MIEISVFQPNNHSQWRIGYKPVTDDQATKLKELLSKNYALGSILSIEQVNETEVNSNNFKIATTRGNFLLRRFLATKDQKIILRTLDLIKSLAGEGVRVPQVANSITGEPLVILNDEFYCLFVFTEASHYQGSKLELESAGTQVGLLDQALSHLSTDPKWQQELSLPDQVKELRRYDLTIWQELFTKARARAEANPDDKFDQDFIASESIIMEAVEKTLKAKPTESAWGVVHFDLHPHNFLANGHEIVAIIDLDSLRYLERARALAFALHRLIRQYIIFNNLNDYPKAVTEGRKLFFDAYKKVNQIDDQELAPLAYFIRDEALSRLTYAMKDLYFNNNPAWKQDLVKQLTNLAEATYFD